MPLTPAQLQDRISAVLWEQIADFLIPWHQNSTDAAPLHFTYRFETSQPGIIPYPLTGWTPFTDAQKAAVAEAFLVLGPGDFVP
jgi:hypothetical protein